MNRLSLNGAWTLDIPGADDLAVPATVPGPVYHDLLCAGRIPDPFYRDNENEALRLMEGSVLFCAPKHFRFEDPKLTVRLERGELVVNAAAYARSVEIRCGAGVVLEDNFFDMIAGERRVRVLRGTAQTPTVRSVYDIR